MKRYYRRVLILSVLVFLFSGGLATETKAQGVLNEILKRMDVHKDWLETLQANVKMAKTNTQLNITTTQEGEIYYISRGGRNVAVRINWEDPEEILSVINEAYTLYQPRLKQAFKGKTKGSENPKANSALSFMNMSQKELKANYKVTYIGRVKMGGSDVWHLGLDPKTKQSYKSAELWVDGDGMPIQAKINELNSDITTVRLSNLKKNKVRIKTSIFKIDLPKNVKIIKG